MGYVRLKDIAEKAGVSINTVSRSLKDKPDIGAETKNRIKEIAAAMGYIPHASASSLRSNQNKTIGVVVTHLANTFFSHILQGINDALSHSEYTILALGSNEDLAKEEKIIKTLYANRVAGLIIVPSQDLISSFDYDSLRVPHINIVRKGSQNSQNYFISDSRMSGHLAAEKILGEGKKNPWYIGYSYPVSCNQQRLLGYREGLEGGGLSLPEERVVLTDSTAAAAYEAVRNLLHRRVKMDSLFIYNDHMAFGVIRALFEAGVRIPDDVSLVGHDDIAETPYVVPSLSSIRVPKYELGYESASCLLDVLAGRQGGLRRVVYHPELINRET
jgi:LacI family transcriptional regulator